MLGSRILGNRPSSLLFSGPHPLAVSHFGSDDRTSSLLFARDWIVRGGELFVGQLASEGDALFAQMAHRKELLP